TPWNASCMLRREPHIGPRPSREERTLSEFWGSLLTRACVHPHLATNTADASQTSESPQEQVSALKRTQLAAQECWPGLYILVLHWNRHILHNLTQHLIRLFRFLQRGCVKAVDDDSVRKYRHGQRLEVFRSAEAAAFEEGHGLGGAI